MLTTRQAPGPHSFRPTSLHSAGRAAASGPSKVESGVEKAPDQKTIAGDPDMSLVRWVHGMGRQPAGPKDNGGRAAEDRVCSYTTFPVNT